MPEEMCVTDQEKNGFILVDGALCWKYTEDNLLLEHYPIEKKDEVLVIDKRIGYIASLENRFVKKLVIYNTHNEELFRNIDTIPAYVNLPALEEIEVIGNDGCFFVKNGCLFHMEDTMRFDIGIQNKRRYGELCDGKQLVPPGIEEYDGKHFYCPKYEMAVRKSDDGQYFARFKQQVYHAFMEDLPDEDTGDIIKISRLECLGFIMTEEIELPSDSCILAEFDKKGGMTPITEYEYHKIDWNEAPEEELEPDDSEECLQAMIKYFADHQKG